MRWTPRRILEIQTRMHWTEQTHWTWHKRTRCWATMAIQLLQGGQHPLVAQDVIGLVDMGASLLRLE